MSNSLTPGQKEALAYLVALRYAAKKVVQAKKLNQKIIRLYGHVIDSAIHIGDQKAEAINKIDLVAANEQKLETKFRIIELGKAFSYACRLCEEHQLPREVWLRALSVNESEWNSQQMREYGQTLSHVVQVLDLENSATKDDDIAHKPLKWCATMAMMNASKTNPKLGKFMHDECNAMFGGAFGDWKEPSVLQRLGAAT